ncbi:hypothetical protein PG994_012708 [Apiospora phragmitis]|uniref:2-dehydropantoate 2-reductase n=1 Tax=Apiospora phragmitis TaxID=2905665 RepID=A0ABR1TB72_9PEZI
MAERKARVLVVGVGGVGAMAAYALEIGGKAEVTAVLRSNYDAVAEKGFTIDSIEHGHDIKGWRPSHIRKTIPDVVQENLEPFDFILVTTKNIPDIPPTVADLIAPAVTPQQTAIVLSQNGLNIERPLLARFAGNPVLSSISLIAATETAPGQIRHDDEDVQYISPFFPPPPDRPSPVSDEASRAEAAARRYVDVYGAGGELGLDIRYEPDAQLARWRKLVYNASFNSVAAVLRMDTARMRASRHVIDDLVKPIMREIIAAASAVGGYEFPADLPDRVVRVDPTDTAFKPSMCQDVEKGNFMEVENIIGEPLREGEARGVAMPTLRTMYGLLKGLQLQVKETRGLWEPKFEEDNPYK